MKSTMMKTAVIATAALISALSLNAETWTLDRCISYALDNNLTVKSRQIEILELMRSRGIDDEHISLMRHCGIDLDSWLHGFTDTEDAVNETVDLIRNHPLMARDVRVGGYIMDSVTGKLQPV